MCLGDITNDARPYQLNSTTNRFTGVGLVAHLGHEFLFFRDLFHETCLVHGPGERFLRVAVLPHLHGQQ